MKKLMFLMCTAILFGCKVYAQENADVNPNKFLLGGNIAFDFSKKHAPKKDSYHWEDGRSNSAFPQFKIYSGFNISSKVAFGLKLGFSYYENTYLHLGFYTYSSNSTGLDVEYGITDGKTFEISPFVRIQNNIVGKLKYYLDFSFGAAFSEQMSALIWFPTHRQSHSVGYSFNYYYANADCGLIYLFSQKAGVELNLVEFEIGKKYEKIDFFQGTEIESVNAKLLPTFIQPNLGFVINL
jgi:hypothetical protein